MLYFSKIYYSGLPFLFLCLFILFYFFFRFSWNYLFWNNISGISNMDLSDEHQFKGKKKKKSYFKYDNR